MSFKNNRIRIDNSFNRIILDMSIQKDRDTIFNIYNDTNNRKNIINKLLDTCIIKFTDDLNILKWFNINPDNLYSFNKKEHIDKKQTSYKEKKYKTIGGSVNELTTFHHHRIYRYEKIKINYYINYFRINRIHFPIIFTDGTKYYVEFTSYPKRKLIIAICTDISHRNEIIHISLFPNSYFHITFIINGNHYKLYHLINPNILNKYDNIIEIINYSLELFNNNNMIINVAWNNSINNNWNGEIIYHPTDRGILIDNIKLHLEILNFLIISLRDDDYMFENPAYFNSYIDRNRLI